MKTFGQRVRAARRQRGWTQKELASASGLTQSAIGNYENGWRTDPTSAALLRLAGALSVTPEWLQQGSHPSLDAQSSLKAGSAQGPRRHSWPFTRVSPKEIEALSPAEKQMLDIMIETFIQTCRLPR